MVFIVLRYAFLPIVDRELFFESRGLAEDTRTRTEFFLPCLYYIGGDLAFLLDLFGSSCGSGLKVSDSYLPSLNDTLDALSFLSATKLDLFFGVTIVVLVVIAIIVFALTR